MKDLFIRSVLFFSAAYFFLAASAIDTNSSHFGDDESTLAPVSKYVTPHGTGNHSGSSWNNAYL